MVSRMDAYVGQVMDKLDELGLDDKTIVLFASDNGANQEGEADPVFFDSSGGLRGVKRDLYEGSIRTPFIVRWPNRVAAGSVSDHIGAFWDIMPTFVELTDAPTPRHTDGISFLPTLIGQGIQNQHPSLHWEL